MKRPRSARANLFRANLSTGNTCNDILTQIKHRRPVTAIPTRRSPKRFVIRSPPLSKTRSNLGFDRPWISSSMMGRSDTTSSSHFRDWTRTWCQSHEKVIGLTYSLEYYTNTGGTSMEKDPDKMRRTRKMAFKKRQLRQYVVLLALIIYHSFSHDSSSYSQNTHTHLQIRETESRQRGTERGEKTFKRQSPTT